MTTKVAAFHFPLGGHGLPYYIHLLSTPERLHYQPLTSTAAGPYNGRQMTYRVRFRFVLSGNRVRPDKRLASTTFYNPSLFSTPDQRLVMAVRAIQRRYGRRIVVWRKAQILTNPGTNRPL